MKCPWCGGTGRTLQDNGDHTESMNWCPHCNRHGWIPYWTPAERAGIKAMGQCYDDECQCERCQGVMVAIYAFVAAARKKKV